MGRPAPEAAATAVVVAATVAVAAAAVVAIAVAAAAAVAVAITVAPAASTANLPITSTNSPRIADNLYKSAENPPRTSRTNNERKCRPRSAFIDGTWITTNA